MTTLPALYPKETATQIRKLLRAAFPATKFSVVTERGSMVSSVRIKWTDGPTVARVEEIAWLFKAGTFDGMTDSYAYDRSSFLEIDGVLYRPGCNYVFCRREMSPAFVARLIAAVVKRWGLTAPEVRVSSYDGSGSVQATPEQDREAMTKTARYWQDLVYQAANDRSAFLDREG